jgi:putative ABC transport system substrate-binding protein
MGYVEGQNIAIEYRWSKFDYERLPALAAELVGRKVDVIVTGNGTPSALAAKSATSTIPIVFVRVTDPGRPGLVASLGRKRTVVRASVGVSNAPISDGVSRNRWSTPRRAR